MTEPQDSVTDPWAWLHEADAPHELVAMHSVAALIVEGADLEASRRTEETLDSLEPGVKLVGYVEADDLADASLEIATDLETEFVWFLPAGCLPAPDCLERLLRCATAESGAQVVSPLLLQPRRRGHGPLIQEFGQTLTGSGRVVSLAEEGDPYQGQLTTTPVLGAGLAGLLVERRLFVELGGFADDVPPGIAGLDLGWRANLAGQRVLAEPSAQLIVAQPATGDEADGAEDHRWGLTLAEAHAARPWLTRWALLATTLLAVVGRLLGKDLAGARSELRGLGSWLRHRGVARALRHSVADLQATGETRHATSALRPGPRDTLRAGLDAVAGRVADWLATFSGRGQDLNLDDLTGDDFAAQRARRRGVSPVLLGGVAVCVLSLVAGRSTWGSGMLTGAQLLPAQETWGALLADYLRPIPGLPGVGAPGWLGLTALGSLLTFGRVDWLVTAVMLGGVALAWFAAFRLLRQVVRDGRIAPVAGFLYALAPVLVGGLNRGMLGLVVWTAVLPMLGYTALTWGRGDGKGWRESGLAGLLLLIATAAVPLTWPIALVAAVIVAVRTPRLRARVQLGVALLAPLLLLVGPGWTTLLRFPGRLLTGTEPALGPLTAPQPWQLLIGQTPGGGLPPVWLAAVVFGLAWLVALLGAVRRPRAAGWALLAASAALTLAALLGRLAVDVAPGTEARPQVQPWLVAMIAGLALAAALGLDGLDVELAARDVGLRHLASLALVIAIVGGSVLAVGWWAWDGETRLDRREVGATMPAFVRNAQVEGAPGRTLAIAMVSGDVRWALVEDDLPRLGASERGIAAGGDAAMGALAASVTSRLVGGSGDDQVFPDLTRLGVSHVWLQGSDPQVRTAISNTPGLGTGTGDEGGAVWPVPASARAVVVEGAARLPVANDAALPAGAPGRTLVLAEPADPRWVASLDGAPLTVQPADDGRQAFALPATGGVLRYSLDDGGPWWAWVQLAGLVLLAALALPEIRPRASASAPRRHVGSGS